MFGCDKVREPWVLWRYLELAKNESIVRSQVVNSSINFISCLFLFSAAHEYIEQIYVKKTLRLLLSLVFGWLQPLPSAG
jgi:hypothetical protein